MSVIGSGGYNVRVREESIKTSVPGGVSYVPQNGTRAKTSLLWTWWNILQANRDPNAWLKSLSPSLGHPNLWYATNEI